MLREDAMIFWQSRNRYKSSAIALAVAKNYSKLNAASKDGCVDGQFYSNFTPFVLNN